MNETNGVFFAPIQQLMNEHVSLRVAMNLFYELAEEIEYESGPTVIHNFTKLYESISDFTKNLKAHSKREDEGLFPMMSRHLGENDKTIEMMEFEHEKAEQHLKDFLLEAKEISENINEEHAQIISVYAVQAYTTLIEHFAKEEKILFPLAEKLLTNEEKEVLAKMFRT